MQSRSHWIIAAIVAVVVGAGVAAVTSGGDDDIAVKKHSKVDQLQLIADSAEVAAGAGSARFEMDMTIDGGTEGSTTVGGGGEIRFEPPGAHMTMDMGGLGGLGNGEFEMVLDGTVMYMKLPAGMPDGPPTPWVSFDIERLAGSDALNEFGAGNDPTQMLDFLRGASSGVKAYGEEMLRGVRVTHYKADVDIQKAIAADPEVARAFEQYELLGAPTVFPVDVWIDEDGLPRKMVMTMDLSAMPGAPAGANISFQMEMFDYGTDVTITPPPAGQVTDMTDQISAYG